MDVIDEEEYNRRSKFTEPLFEDTCIEKDGMVYPIKKKYDETPGVYDAGPLLKYTKPEQNQEQYSSSNIIDFSNAKSFKDVIERQDNLKRSEEAILTTKDNIFVPVIYDDDLPELVATKQMLSYKAIDLESYRGRFGGDFNNITRGVKDKKNKTITFYRLKTFCNAMDVKATLTLEDKEGAINPMGRKIEVNLTSSEE